LEDLHEANRHTFRTDDCIEGAGVRDWWQKTGRSRFGKRFARFIEDEMSMILKESK